MSYVTVGGRVYVPDLEDFAYKQRTMLNIADSAVILADIGVRKGYVGLLAKEKLVDPVEKKNALNETFDVPLDFRSTGISVLDSFGISKDIQGAMFENFMKNYTLEQRRVYISMFEQIDPNDHTAVSAFVNNMLSMLVG